MRGRLGAETKKHNSEIAERDKEILDLHNKLSRLSDEIVRTNQMMTRVNERASPPQPPRSLITPEDLERHGEDTVDFVKRAATEAVADQLANLQTKMLRLIKNLAAPSGI